MSRRSSLLLPVLVAVAVTPSVAEASPRTGDVTVLVPSAASGSAAANARAASAAAPGATVVRRIPEIGVVELRPASGTSAAALARGLRGAPGVLAATTERRMVLRAAKSVTPDDPALSDPELTPGTDAGTALQWSAFKLRLPQAWAIARGGGVRVGVIDSGLDAAHPDLNGKVLAAVNQSESASARTDEQGHGTHVSSIACAGSGNGIGIAGTGFSCKLVFEKTDLGDTSVAASIVDAVKRGAKVISMSFGTDGARSAPPAITRAIDYAVKHDVVLVAAAADDPVDEQGDPANVLQPTGTAPNIASGKGLVVTAATVDGQRAAFAGRGSQISLAAYGAYRTDAGGPSGIFADFPSSLTSLDTGTFTPGPLGGVTPPCGCRATLRGQTDYAYLAGTSMATPQVAGIAALVRSANRKLTAKQTIRILKSTAKRTKGWSSDLGWGIVNAEAAVKLAKRTKGNHR